MARVEPGTGGGRRVGGIKAAVINDALPVSIEIVFDEMLDAGGVPEYAPELWIRFMIRVCRENPCLPGELVPVIDVTEQYHLGVGKTDADIRQARVAVSQCDAVASRDSIGKLKDTGTTIDDRQGYASYLAVRGLYCLLSAQNEMQFTSDLEQTLFWFVDFMTTSTEHSSPDFHYRMTEILHECLCIAPEQNASD